MKNIAILIGNSEYHNLDKLDFCKKDINLMQKLLKLSKKFEINIFEDYTSEQLKSRLSEIIKQLENCEINELLLYYTGHGVFKDQFYYLPINFTDKQFETTGLSNDELDDMLRSLKVGIVIKIIDACQSGELYIKDGNQNLIEKTFKKYSFNKCYFFFSSMNNQYSMGDDKGSYFTNIIIESILTHKTDSIRYRDIQAYIADNFKGINEAQTPFFIHQANATEIFLDNLNFIQESFKDDSFIINNEEKINQQIENEIDIAQQFKNLSKEYISKDKAQENIKYIFDENKIKDIFDTNIKSIYEIEIDKHDNYNIADIGKLYNEIEKNKENFFVYLKYKEETYTTTEWALKKKKPRNGLEALYYSSFLRSNEEYEEKEIQRTRKVIDLISLKDGILPIGVAISLIPKKDIRNTRKYLINIINFHNDREIIFYSNIVQHYKSNWDAWDKVDTGDWIKNKVSFCSEDKILEKIKTIVDNYQQIINNDISKLLMSAKRNKNGIIN